MEIGEVEIRESGGVWVLRCKTFVSGGKDLATSINEWLAAEPFVRIVSCLVTGGGNDDPWSEALVWYRRRYRERNSAE